MGRSIIGIDFVGQARLGLLRNFELSSSGLLFILMLSATPLGIAAEEEQLQLTLDYSSDTVARIGDLVLTHADLDVRISEISERDQAQFISSRQRIGEAMEQMFLRRAGAQAAIDSGMLDDPEIAAELYEKVARELSQRHRDAWLDDRMLDDYSEQGRELYLAHRNQFKGPRLYSFSHVLIRTSDRSESEAMRRILDLHERVGAGEDFEALIEEYTEDSTETERPGHYEAISADQLDRNFARSLKNLDPGELSEPVRSRFGWHLIRLEKDHGREDQSWEGVEEEARALARQRHRERLKKRYFSELISFDDVEIEPGAIEELQRRYGYDPEADKTEESED